MKERATEDTHRSTAQTELREILELEARRTLCFTPGCVRRAKHFRGATGRWTALCAIHGAPTKLDRMQAELDEAMGRNRT